MEDEKLRNIIGALCGLKYYEWKSIESAVNMEFSAMSNRLELIDVSRIQKIVASEIIH